MDSKPLHRPLLLLEPWALGDAVIASVAASELDRPATVYCRPEYHVMLNEILNERARQQGRAQQVTLAAISLNYTQRGSNPALDFFRDLMQQQPIALGSEAIVMSIRGDLRDYLIAKRIFPTATFFSNGWNEFWARRVLVWDFLLKTMGRSVTNRYEQWLTLFRKTVQTNARMTSMPQSKHHAPQRILIHLGAQWRSKAYPYVAELVRNLVARGLKVSLARGPGDPLPLGIDEAATLTGVDLIQAVKQSDLVICNDSGPMHVSAAIGAKVLVIAAASNIHQWLPPGALAICAAEMPRGYRPLAGYASDAIVATWPDATEVVNQITATLGGLDAKPAKDATDPNGTWSEKSAV